MLWGGVRVSRFRVDAKTAPPQRASDATSCSTTKPIHHHIDTLKGGACETAKILNTLEYGNHQNFSQTHVLLQKQDFLHSHGLIPSTMVHLLFSKWNLGKFGRILWLAVSLCLLSVVDCLWAISSTFNSSWLSSEIHSTDSLIATKTFVKSTIL